MAYTEPAEPDQERLSLASALITALHLLAVPTIVTLTAIFPSQLVAAFPWTVAIIIPVLILLGGLSWGYFQNKPLAGICWIAFPWAFLMGSIMHATEKGMVRAEFYFGLWLLTWPLTFLLYGHAVHHRREEQRKRILFSNRLSPRTASEWPHSNNQKSNRYKSKNHEPPIETKETWLPR